MSSVPRPLHSSSLPAENLTIKEGGTIYGRVIRTRSLNSQYQVKLPETIDWLEFRFSNNRWSAGYPDDRYPRITGAGLVTEVTPDQRLRPIFTIFTISRSKFSRRPGEDAQLIFLLLGQVTDTIWYQIKGNKMMLPWGNKGNTFCKKYTNENQSPLNSFSVFLYFVECDWIFMRNSQNYKKKV